MNSTDAKIIRDIAIHLGCTLIVIGLSVTIFCLCMFASAWLLSRSA